MELLMDSTGRFLMSEPSPMLRAQSSARLDVSAIAIPTSGLTSDWGSSLLELILSGSIVDGAAADGRW